jgi:hypothetical protein
MEARGFWKIKLKKNLNHHRRFLISVSWILIFNFLSLLTGQKGQEMTALKTGMKLLDEYWHDWFLER